MTSAVLTPRQKRFVDEYMVDGKGSAAAIRAGYSPDSAKVMACRMLSTKSTQYNHVRRAIQARQDADSERLGVTREGVVQGLLEAVNTARAQSNPMAMISGLRELGRLMGFYTPAKVDVGVRADGSPDDYQKMTDGQLMAIIEAG